jgi:hypothetical protein
MAADILNLATFMRAGDEHRLELGLGDAMARLMARIFHLLYTFLRPLLGATDTARLPRSTWCFALLFVYFLCSQILTNATAIYNIGYYGLVLPSFLYAAIKHPSRIRQIPCSVGAVGIAVFLVFVALHAVIGQFPDQSLSKTLLGALFTGIFVLMSMSFFNARDIDSLALLRCFLLTVIVMAPISYVLFRIHPTTYSLLPIGRAHNPIPIGNLYAMAALIATWLFFQPRTSMRWKLTALYGIATVILTILATTQRGPLLALFVGGGCWVADHAAMEVARTWRRSRTHPRCGLLLLHNTWPQPVTAGYSPRSDYLLFHATRFTAARYLAASIGIYCRATMAGLWHAGEILSRRGAGCGEPP